MRPHGEQWFLNKKNFYNNQTNFDDCQSIDSGLPKRMSKDEIIAYYNKKLHAYWSSIMFQELPEIKRKKAINYLMFNTIHTKHKDGQ